MCAAVPETLTIASDRRCVTLFGARLVDPGLDHTGIFKDQPPTEQRHRVVVGSPSSTSLYDNLRGRSSSVEITKSGAGTVLADLDRLNLLSGICCPGSVDMPPALLLNVRRQGEGRGRTE
jgi:hypothetical protein